MRWLREDLYALKGQKTIRIVCHSHEVYQETARFLDGEMQVCLSMLLRVNQVKGNGERLSKEAFIVVMNILYQFLVGAILSLLLLTHVLFVQAAANTFRACLCPVVPAWHQVRNAHMTVRS